MEAKPSKRFRAERLVDNPIIYPDMPGLEGELGNNINGPSLIRVPEWVEEPLGKYYLYFAHHGGKYIRLAYSDQVEGPWMVYPPGVLGVDDGPGRGHIASPDVHMDEERCLIRLYFHQPAPEEKRDMGQVSFLALSENGLRFDVREEILGQFYLRVFQHGGWYYAYAKNTNVNGILYRSADGLTGFEPGPEFLPGIRHAATWVDGDTLHLFFSAAGETPERILVSTIDLTQPWPDWKASEPEVVLEPELEWEGADLPLEASRYGAARGRVRQLRDPGIFEEDGQLYLLYSVAGEQGIAIARLEKNYDSRESRGPSISALPAARHVWSGQWSTREMIRGWMSRKNRTARRRRCTPSDKKRIARRTGSADPSPRIRC